MQHGKARRGPGAARCDPGGMPCSTCRCLLSGCSWSRWVLATHTLNPPGPVNTERSAVLATRAAACPLPCPM